MSILPDRRGVAAAAVAVVALALGGTSAVVAGVRADSQGPPQPEAAASAPAATPPPASAAPSAPPLPARAGATSAAQAMPPPATTLDVPTMPRARPVGLAIPSIGVASRSIVELATEADGSLEVPRDYGQPGWFTPGPAPGQLGPAVIAGHVDSEAGPGIFYRLGELRPGATVEVARDDGTTARFVVDKVERYPKNAFPTTAVYGDTTHRSELRLITCGGAFDRSTGHYVDNVVAYAHLI